MKAIARRQQYRDELRSLILETARELFVRGGCDSFSMRKLATEIGYSPGSIYLHFKNKKDLFQCLVEESFARLLTALEVVRDGRERNAVKLLKKGLRLYVDFGLRHPNDYRTAFLLPPASPKGPYKPHTAFDVLREIVTRCVEQGRFRNADVEATSQALWAAAHGITSLLIQRPTFPWVARDKLINRVIDSAVDSQVVD